MTMIVTTPEPPYVAVIFTSLRTAAHGDEYAAMAERMEVLARTQPGYFGIESARSPEGFGISVAYFTTQEHARAWKQNVEHLGAQKLGREKFYAAYRVRIATVEREYGFAGSGS
jgi:heme-degrading monooxygenase HmoA